MDRDKAHRIKPDHLANARRLRRESTPIEAKLWSRLRGGRLSGLKFRHQYPIGPYIADFYCAEHSLIVELDGESHGYQEDYDRARTEWMRQHGYTVIRFSNQEVGRNLDGVLATIWEACGAPGLDSEDEGIRGSEPSTLTPGPSPWEGEGGTSDEQSTLTPSPSPYKGEGGTSDEQSTLTPDPSPSEGEGGCSRGDTSTLTPGPSPWEGEGSMSEEGLI